nr:glycoprotein Xg isoform X12 [Equus asinus]
MRVHICLCMGVCVPVYCMHVHTYTARVGVCVCTRVEVCACVHMFPGARGILHARPHGCACACVPGCVARVRIFLTPEMKAVFRSPVIAPFHSSSWDVTPTALLPDADFCPRPPPEGGGGYSTYGTQYGNTVAKIVSPIVSVVVVALVGTVATYCQRNRRRNCFHTNEPENV